jgi:hypothetical protein
MMLFVCAAVYGALGAFLFRRFTDPKKLRDGLNRILARAMEFALYFDEPSVILRAQIALARENVRLLRAIAVPTIAMAVIFAALYQPLDRRYGDLIGNVITVRLGQALPTAYIAETPGVRIVRTNQESWRVRAAAPRPSTLFGWNWTIWFAAVASVVSIPLLFTRTI